jgi:hypothetical protein
VLGFVKNIKYNIYLKQLASAAPIIIRRQSYAIILHISPLQHYLRWEIKK